ncbi:YDG/SRA domain-containing protein [Pimelobacter sp. 30-1]|uniref:YDG/SRA domain-containing protein n=1 Tax=Pimelobacter sp. 30-1 TaxID=2004991 RepID=UPI001C042619|nr:YDG/SRA domain-containing protein [Pimelobacter sp. 30-1]
MSKADYYFGELEGHPVGSTYASRAEAMAAGIHRFAMQGISGSAGIAANCIALSKGYVDDEDHGDWILYTGAGGKDPKTDRQIADQEITQYHNASLVYSEEGGLPVRVLRGHKGEKPYAPKVGFRYDGLYQVTRHWAEQGRDGFRIWRFHLVRLTPDEARPWTPAGQRPATGPVGDADFRADVAPPTSVTYEPSAEAPAGNPAPHRATGIVQRIVRSSRVAKYIKELHGHRCQVCGLNLDLPVAPYSEGAHIRALGMPHNGPDTHDNVLCLCPNHHVLLDKGGIYLDDHLIVRDHAGNELGPLTVVNGHDVSLTHVRYHREHHGFAS